MAQHAPDVVIPLNRRRLLQGTLAGAAGLRTWLHGWPRLLAAPATPGGPSGQMTWAAHVTLTPSLLDPAEVLPVILPYMLLYAVHDALLKPMPGHLMTPCLATAWHESADGLTYEFTLREGVTFHNGDPFTAEDVHFSFARYRGAGAALLQSKVRAVEIVTPHQVRFHLHAPWPDFLTVYGTPASGAGWIVPQRYTTQVGDQAFQQHPIGLGPYRVVRQQPGIELVLEAYTGYWRKTPSVKRLVIKSVPDATTRLAMLKNQEADVAYVLLGPLAAEVRRDATLKLEPVVPPATQWLAFVDQYDATSPWADKRVRLAANHAVNWPAINEAEHLGYAVLTGNIVPHTFDYALRLEPYGYDPTTARQLLTDAGYPHGFEAGECSTDTVYASVVEAVLADLSAVGIRLRVRPMERAAHLAAVREKRVKNLTRMGTVNYGNAASVVESFLQSHSPFSLLKDPDIDAWCAQQAMERDRPTREALLHQIQQKVYEEVRVMPMWELTSLHASGPRVAVSGLGLIPLFAYSAPYEDVQLKS
jgi:peptide/nickel transport system substrate-binding protein